MADPIINFDNLRRAVAILNHIFDAKSIQYALGGCFAAQMFTDKFTQPSTLNGPPDIEVFYNPDSTSALEESLQEHGGIGNCVLTDEKGVRVPVLFRKFNEPLKGPRGSPANRFGHKPNFFHHRLGFNPEIVVPFLLPEVSLKIALGGVLEGKDTDDRAPTSRVFDATDAFTVSATTICDDWNRRNTDFAVALLLERFARLYFDKIVPRPEAWRSFGLMQHKLGPRDSSSGIGVIPLNNCLNCQPVSRNTFHPAGLQSYPCPSSPGAHGDTRTTDLFADSTFISQVPQSSRPQTIHSTRDPGYPHGIVYGNKNYQTLPRPTFPNISHPQTAPSNTTYCEYDVYNIVGSVYPDMIITAIKHWVKVAQRAKIKYTLVGRVAGWLLGSSRTKVHYIEVYFTKEDEDRLQKFADDTYDEGLLRVTTEGDHIIVIDRSMFTGVPFMMSKLPDGVELTTTEIPLNTRDPSNQCGDLNVRVPEPSCLRKWIGHEYYVMSQRPFIPRDTCRENNYIDSLKMLMEELFWIEQRFEHLRAMRRFREEPTTGIFKTTFDH